MLYRNLLASTFKCWTNLIMRQHTYGSRSAQPWTEGYVEARDDARDNVEDERLVDLQSEAGTIYESLNISLD